MKMRQFGILLGVISLACMLAALGAAAKPTIDYVRIPGLQDLTSMKDTLKLTNDQITRYKSLREVYQEKVKDLSGRIDIKEKELLDLMKAEQPNALAIDGKVKELQAAEQVQIAAAIQFYTDFAKNLAKEQVPVFWAEAGKTFLKLEAPKPPKPATQTAPAAPKK